MLRPHFAFALLLAFGAAAPAPAQSPAEAEYQALVQRVKGGDLTVDFARMRALYTETGAYQPYGTAADNASRAERMARTGDHEAGLALANQVLDTYYVSIAAHYAAALAYKKLGDKQREVFHGRVWAGMMRAVLASGDGRTAATAMRVLTVSDEYHVLRALRVTPGKRVVAREEGRVFDRWEAKEASGADRLVYFDITLMFAKLSAAPRTR